MTKDEVESGISLGTFELIGVDPGSAHLTSGTYTETYRLPDGKYLSVVLDAGSDCAVVSFEILKTVPK